MGGLINILVIPESAQITARQLDLAKHVYTALHLKYWNVLSVYQECQVITEDSLKVRC